MRDVGRKQHFCEFGTRLGPFDSTAPKNIQGTADRKPSQGDDRQAARFQFKAERKPRDDRHSDSGRDSAFDGFGASKRHRRPDFQALLQ